MKPQPAVPLFIVDIDNGVDVWLGSSLAAAAAFLEAVDVAKGIYVGYDAEGRQLAIGTDGPEPGFWRGETRTVTVDLSESEPAHDEELRGWLLKYLAAVNEPQPSDTRLSVLVEVMKKVHKWSDGRRTTA